MAKMPEIELPHIYEWWEEIGRYEILSSGIIPLTFQEVLAWSKLSGINLVENEANIIKILSCEYVSMYNKGRKRDCPAPFTPDCTQDDLQKAKERTAEQMRKLKKGS